MKRPYTVLIGPVDHDGARYEEGEEISLQGDEAAPLVELGVIEPLPAKEVKPRKPAD
jgi:hypothetical protein